MSELKRPETDPIEILMQDAVCLIRRVLSSGEEIDAEWDGNARAWVAASGVKDEWVCLWHPKATADC